MYQLFHVTFAVMIMSYQTSTQLHSWEIICGYSRLFQNHRTVIMPSMTDSWYYFTLVAVHVLKDNDTAVKAHNSGKSCVI